MSDDAKVPLPVPDDSNEWSAPLWDEDSLRAYGDARERAARAAEREACIAEANAVLETLRKLHRMSMGYEDACVARGAELVADALRARAEGQSNG